MEFLKLNKPGDALVAMIVIILAIYYVFRPEIERYCEKLKFAIRYWFNFRFMRWIKGTSY